MKRILQLPVLAFFISISFTSFAQSDGCASATVIDPNTGCVSGSNETATSSLTTNGCTPDPVNEVWYTYTVEGTQDNFTVTTGTMEDAVMTLYADGCATGTYDYCTTAAGTADITATYAFAEGTQVWVSIASTSLTDGDFDLCITSTTTTNDEPGSSSCEPIAICAESNISFSDMSLFATSGTKASCFSGPGANATQDAWISFCVEESGDITWDANPASNATEFDWAMFDITDDCPGTEVACNYDWNQQTGANFGMEIGNATAGDDYNDAFFGIAGHCYAIQIVNWSIDGTGVSFSGVDENCATCAKISPGVNFSVNQTDPCSPPVTATFNTGVGHDGTVNWDFGNGNTSLEAGTPSTETYTDPGVYPVTSWAGSGSCYEQQTEYITVYGPLAATSAMMNDFCDNTNGGEISVAPTGGDGIFTYAWTPNVSSGPTATGLAPGNYSIEVCNAVCGQCVTIPVTLTGYLCCGVDVTFGPQRLCMSDAPITLNPGITGATSYTTAWSAADGSTAYLSSTTAENPTFTPPTGGVYTMQLEVDNTADPGGCVTPRTVVYTVIDVLPAGAATATTCPGTCDGTVNVPGISGGVAPYVTTWDMGLSAGTNHTGLCAGTYTATVTEDGGCLGTLPLVVTEAVPFSLDAGGHNCNTTPLNPGDCYTLPGTASITQAAQCNNTTHNFTGTTTITNPIGSGQGTPVNTTQGVSVSGTAAGDELSSICFTIDHSKHTDLSNVFITAPDGTTQIFYFADATITLNGAGIATYCFDAALIDGYSGTLDGTWTLTIRDGKKNGGGTGDITDITIITCSPYYDNLWSPLTDMTGDPTTFTPEVCPTVTTTYTITLTDENGCTITDEVEVIVGACTLLGATDFTFNSSYSAGTVKIDWQVLDDSSIEKYMIENSSDGENFSQLIKVNSNKTETVNNYSIFDQNPTEGLNYYKLIAYDQHEIIVFEKRSIVNASEGASVVQILPNPAVDDATLVFEAAHKGESEIKVYDVSGKMVFSQKQNITKGSNSILLDASSLSEGMYTVLFSAAGESHITKFIKEK